LEGEYSVVFLLPGKSKEETLNLFAKASKLLKEDGWIVVSMENKLGAGRFEKAFAELFGEIKSISKNRCRAFASRKSSTVDGALLGEYESFAEKEIGEGGYVTVPGIFSESAIDEGSLLLAELMPKSFRGSVADFGAGWGYLSSKVLQSKGKLRELHLFELDKRALECAKRNVLSGSVDLSFHWCDVTKGVSKKFDLILMNPPFHQGRQMTVGLGKDFITVAAKALKPQGELWMVANRQLPYEEHLEESELRWRIVDQGPRYKIICARKVARL